MTGRRVETHGYELLRASLRALPPSGPGGFEGLVRDLLSELTGRRFFLAAAGSQHGRDLSTGGLGGTWIAVEAKRYRERKSPDREKLSIKLTQLGLQNPHADLWILVSSSPVHDQVVTELRQIGLKSGVEIEIVDAPADRPGDLDFLCAAYQNITFQYLEDSVSLALEELKRKPGFTQRLETLRQRFSAPALGFDHVRQRAQTWFLEALATTEESRARLGQPLDLLSPTNHCVRRAEADRALEAWWQAWPQDPRPFVLLGEEGVGKTWVAAAWAESQGGRGLETILLFVPSRDISTTKPDELICRFLCEVTGSNCHQSGFWEARLEGWLGRHTEPSPQILLILDGINELPSFAWRDLFDRLAGNPWRERIAVLVTCRPRYWVEEKFMPGQEPQRSILEVFEDHELDEALQANGRRRSDFASDLLPLLRKPRYLSRALRYYDRLEETGDFTPDRLLYEDWKDRLERKRSLKLTDGEFRSLLSELARRYMDGRIRFSQRDLEDLLPRDAATDLAEVLTGGLMTVEAGLGQSYKVESGWLIHGLGLLLASELRGSTDETKIDEELAHFLEPHVEIDQQGDILAAAVLYALFTPDYSSEARHALLHAWVSRQNHTQTSVDRLQAYVPIGYEDYLDVLEDSTLDRSLDHRATERLEYALLAWRSLPGVEAALVHRASRWLSLVHPEGFPYMRPQDQRGKLKGSAKLGALEMLRQEIEERAGGPVRPGRPIRIAQNAILQVTSSDRFSWLADSALYFLSALPTRFRLLPLRLWALSRAVMGSPKEWTQVAWLLRRPATTDFEDQFLEIVDPHLGDPQVAVSRAGGELLACMGTPRAIDRRSELPQGRRRIAERHRTDRDDDPCKRWLYGWRREDCPECSQREDLDDLFVARKLSPHTLDPNFDVPDAAVPRIRNALKAIDLSNVWSYRGRTSADGDLESIEPAIAVAAPRQLVAAYRTVVRSQTRDEEGWKALAHNLAKVHPLLDRQKERSILRKCWQGLHQCTAGKNDQLVYEERDLFAALIASRPAKEQLDALLSRPTWAIHPIDLLASFEPMTPQDINTVLETLSQSQGIELERRLVFLLAQKGLTFTQESEDFLCSLLNHGERSSNEPPSRFLAVQVVLRSGQEGLLEKAILAGGLHPSDVVLFLERWQGERLLSFRTRTAYLTLRSAFDLATVGHILSANNRLGGDLPAYAEDLDKTIRHERERRSSPFHPLFRIGFSVSYIRELVRRRPELVEGWVDLAIQEDVDWSQINFLKSTYLFYESLCEALFLEQDPRASELYISMRQATRQKAPMFQDRIGDALPLLLFRVDVDEVRPHRKASFRACGGDAALLDFATAARRNGRDDFLLELVEEGLSSPRYFDRAKGISLAGWCGRAPEIRSLLENLSVTPGSWLDSLKEQALARVSREDWARSWFEEYLFSRSLVRSFAAFRLFLRCVDRRYWAWRSDVLMGFPKDSRTGQRRLRFLTTSYREIEKAIERNEKDLNKYFLYLPIPDERLAPWTGLPNPRTVRRPRGNGADGL